MTSSDLPPGITVDDRWLHRPGSSGRWTFRVRDPIRRRYISKTWPDDQHAEGLEWAQDEQAKLRLGMTRAGRCRLADVREAWLKELERTNRSATHRQQVRSTLLSAEAAGIRELTDPALRERVRAWLEDMRVKPITANGRLTMLRGAVRYAVAEGMIYVDPLAAMRPVIDPSQSTIPRLYHPEALRQILACAQPMRLPLAVGIYGGLRLGEVAAMRWSWLDWEGGCIRIRQGHGWTPKRHRERDVPILAELRSLLRPGAQIGDALVFPDLAGTMESERSKLASAAIDAAGITRDHGQGFHRLRHTWISYRLSLGVDLYRVKKESGHRTVVTTEGYGQIVPEGWLAGWPRGGEFYLTGQTCSDSSASSRQAQ